MVLSRKLYCRVFISFALAFVFFYLTIFSNFVIPENYDIGTKNLNDNSKNNKGGKVKKIVAYSLLKQIEIDSVEYPCQDSNIVQKNFTKFLINRNNGNETNNDTKGHSWIKIDDTELFISSVNLDTRLQPYHYVRLLGVVKGSWKQNQSLYCQIFRNDGSFYVVKPTITNIWYEKWDFNDSYAYYQPTLLSCRIPESSEGIRLSLSSDACKVNSNNFELKKLKKPQRYIRNFTICVKPLNFNEEIGTQLIQWIEMNKIFGAEKFEISVQSVKGSVWKILNWYTKTYATTFKVRQFTPLRNKELKPTTADNQTANASHNFSFHEIWQRRRYEVLTYNNCFYQNLDSKFVIPLDVDELIVPKFHKNWAALLKNYEEFLPEYSSFVVQNYYFFKKVKKSPRNDVFFLQNNRKTKHANPRGANSKSFIITNNSLTIFNHYTLHTLRPSVSKCYFMPKKEVQLNHYKETCESVILPECTMYMSSQKVVDNVMLKYEGEFLNRYQKVLTKNNLHPG